MQIINYCLLFPNLAAFLTTIDFELFLDLFTLILLSITFRHAQTSYLCNTCSVFSWQALKFTSGAPRDVNFIDMAESDTLLWGRGIQVVMGRTDG